MSLYCGCGGLDLGFLKAGFECLGAFDSDSDAVQTYFNNLGHTAHQTNLLESEESIITLIKRADLLLAGPPCQGFSTAGKNDPNDNRNFHLINVVNIAIAAKPNYLIIENVKGLIGKVHKRLFDKARRMLDSAGYEIHVSTFDTSDYGLAQSRVRVVLFATKKKHEFRFDLKSAPRKNLSDVLKSVEKVRDFQRLLLPSDSDSKNIARAIKPGQKLSNVRAGPNSVHTWEIPDVFGAVTAGETSILESIVRLRRRNRRRNSGDADPVEPEVLVSMYGKSAKKIIESLVIKNYLRRIGNYIDLTNTFNGKYRRLHWDGISPTVDTRFGQPRYFLHPKQDRGFCYREAARIQSFPDEFEFIGSESSKFRMIGNAVPPDFSFQLAQFVKSL